MSPPTFSIHRSHPKLVVEFMYSVIPLALMATTMKHWKFPLYGVDCNFSLSCSVYHSPNFDDYVKFFVYLDSEVEHIITHSPFTGISIFRYFSIHHKQWLLSSFTDELSEKEHLVGTLTPGRLGDTPNIPDQCSLTFSCFRTPVPKSSLGWTKIFFIWLQRLQLFQNFKVAYERKFCLIHFIHPLEIEQQRCH